MYYLQQSGYDEVREYVEELEEQYGEDLRAEDEESNDEVDESGDESEAEESEPEEDVDPEPPEDATEESDEETTEDAEEPDTFAEGFAEAVEEDDLTRYTVGDLESNIGDVDDAELLEQAFRTDSRTTAQDAYADRYQELTGSDLEGDDE